MARQWIRCVQKTSLSFNATEKLKATMSYYMIHTIQFFNTNSCSLSQVTSYQRSCSSPSSPNNFQSQLEIQPLAMQLPLQMQPIQMAPLTMPMVQPFGQTFLKQAPWPLMSPFNSAFKVMGQSADNSSGYASCSSSSSLFNQLPKVNTQEASYFFEPNVQTPASPTSSTTSKTCSSSNGTMSKATFLKESLVKVLDQVDGRVAFLRETANELEDEKRKLLEALLNVENANELALIAEGECA